MAATTDYNLDGTERVGEYTAMNWGAQTAIRNFLKSQGTKMSWRQIGKTAGRAGKVAGVIGWGISLTSAYKGYQSCRSF